MELICARCGWEGRRSQNFYRPCPKCGDMVYKSQDVGKARKRLEEISKEIAELAECIHRLRVEVK